MSDRTLFDDFNTLFNCYMSECDGADCERCKYRVKDPVGLMLAALSFIGSMVWKPVTEKEPEVCGHYLVTVETPVGSHFTGVASYGPATGWSDIAPWYGNVVAWTALPAAWGGEE